MDLVINYNLWVTNGSSDPESERMCETVGTSEGQSGLPYVKRSLIHQMLGRDIYKSSCMWQLQMQRQIKFHLTVIECLFESGKTDT